MFLKYFFPPVFKNKRLFSEKVLSISIEQGIIYSAIINQTRTGNYLEKLMETSFSMLPHSSKKFGFDRESLQGGLNKIIYKARNNFDYIQVTIPGFLSIFKELVLPFSDIDKIKLIVKYETEPRLPFQPDEFSLGFLKEQDTEKNEAQVLTASIKDIDMQKITSFFNENNAEPVRNLFVDTVINYGLILQVPDYIDLEHTTVFLDFRPNITTLGFISNSTLKFIKNFNISLQSIIESVAKKNELDSKKLFEILSISGIYNYENKTIVEDLKKELKSSFNSFKLSFDAFFLDNTSAKTIGKLVIFDHELLIKDFNLLCQNELNIQSEYFSSQAWIKSVKLKNKATTDEILLEKHIRTLGAVLYPNKFKTFSLGKDRLQHPEKKILSKQIVIAIFLITAIFSTIILRGMLKVSNLEKTIVLREKSAVERLKKNLPKDIRFSKNTTLKRVLSLASTSIAERNSKLASFSYQVPDILTLVLDLTRLMDSEKFGTRLDSLNIYPNPEEQNKYYVKISGVFKEKKTISKDVDFQAMIENLKSSKYLSLAQPIEQEAVEGSGKIKFSLTMRVDHENT